MKKLEDVLQRLNSFTNYEKEIPRAKSDLGLVAVRRLWEVLGYPARSLPTFHIAGTKGKGSTAAILESLFCHAGYRVGVYTSPHLVSVCERIRIAGQSVAEDVFCQQALRVCDEVDQLIHKEQIHPTWFDIMTMISFLVFETQKVELVILEVGLGGRQDSTNVCQPTAALITRLGLDHENVLGESIEKIAHEKAGIIKPRVPTYTVMQENAAMGVLKKNSELNEAEMKVLGEDFYFIDQPLGREFVYKDQRFVNLRLGATGDHQWENAGLALAAFIDYMRSLGQAISLDVLRQALQNVEIPGRFQVMGRYLLDCAHNPLSMNALVKALEKKELKNLKIIIGMCRDKKVENCLKILSPYADEFWFVPVPSARSLDSQALRQEMIRCGITKKTYCFDSVRSAVEKIERLKIEEPILVTGSVYLVGEISQILKEPFENKHEAMSCF